MTQQPTMQWSAADIAAAEQTLARTASGEVTHVVTLTDEEVEILDGLQNPQLVPLTRLDAQAGAVRARDGRGVGDELVVRRRLLRVRRRVVVRGLAAVVVRGLRVRRLPVRGLAVRCLRGGLLLGAVVAGDGVVPDGGSLAGRVERGLA